MKVYNQLPIISPQDRLAVAWAVLYAEYARLPAVSERVLLRCRQSTKRLTAEEALDLLEAVPAVLVP